MPDTPGKPTPIRIVKQGPVEVSGTGATSVTTIPTNLGGMLGSFGQSVGIGYVAPGGSCDHVFPVKNLVLPATLAGTSTTSGVTVSCVFERAYTAPYNPGTDGGPKLDTSQQGAGKGGVTMVNKLDSMGPTVAAGSPQPTQYRVTVHVAATASRGLFTAPVVLKQATGDAQTITLDGNIGAITGTLKGAPAAFPEGQWGNCTMTVTNDSVADVTVTVAPGNVPLFSFDTQQVALKAHAQADIALKIQSTPQVTVGAQSVAVSLSALVGLMKAEVFLACTVGPPLTSLWLGTFQANDALVAGSTRVVSGQLLTTGPDDPSPKWTLSNLPKGVTVASTSFPTRVSHGENPIALQMMIDPTIQLGYPTTAKFACSLYGGQVNLTCDVNLPRLLPAMHQWDDTGGGQAVYLYHGRLNIDSTGSCELYAITGNDDSSTKMLATSKDWVLIAGLTNARKALLIFNDGKMIIAKNTPVYGGASSTFVAQNWQTVFQDQVQWIGANPGAAVLGDHTARAAWLLKTYGWTEL